LCPDSRAYTPARVGLVGITLLLTTTSESLWDFARNSPTESEDDPDQSEETSGSADQEEDGGADGPEEGEDESSEGSTEEGGEDVEKCVLIYVRVSSNEQKEDGRSLESQEDELTSIVEANPDMRSFTPEPIRDEGKTGTNFDRPGIQRVTELAHEDEVTHLFVDTLDRIGRSVAETIMFIKNLRNECGVKLRTRAQEFDILKPTDKMQLTMLAAMADFGTMNRARSAHRSKADNFLKDKEWSSWYGDYIPIGYKEKDDGWIEPSEDWVPIIRELYDLYIDTENYVEVKRRINSKYPEILSDYDEIEGDELSRQQIRRILTRPVYKGEPTLPITSLEHYESNPSRSDPNLAIVSDKVFNKVEKIVQKNKEKNSANDEVTFSPAEYAEEFSPFAVDTVSPTVQLKCPKCLAELISNGQYLVDRQHASRMYNCSNEECDYQRRWPNRSEREMMKMLVKFDEFHSIL
jgi:DNA invertase Pin-like site-specific DNA recombinase